MLSVMSEGLYLRVEHISPKVTITSGKINTFFKPRLTNATLATVNKIWSIQQDLFVLKAKLFLSH